MTHATAQDSQNAHESEQLQRRFMEATKPKSLHELVDELLAIMTDVDAAEGEVTAEQDKRLAELDLTLEQKVEGYAAACERMDAEAESLKSLAQRYTAKAKLRSDARERLRDRLHLEMVRAGRDVVKTATASARIQNSPERLELDGDDAEIFAKYVVPKDYVVQPPAKLDRKALIAAIKAGAVFPFASVVKPTHLRFR